MKVAIIGAGNVATVLGNRIIQAGHQVIQIISRRAEHAKLLAIQLGSKWSINAADIDCGADIYLVAISDAALNELPGSYRLGDRLVVHTAGAISMDVLKMISSNYGVVYPLQSLRKENPVLHQVIPFLIDGNTDAARKSIENFASSMSSIVRRSTEGERLKLHIAAVLVSNFTNHLYAVAAGYCDREGVDFKMLQPLIEETALRLRCHLPAEMQTGPATRKDIATLDKHLRALSGHPKIKSIYLKMTDSIMHP